MLDPSLEGGSMPDFAVSYLNINDHTLDEKFEESDFQGKNAHLSMISTASLGNLAFLPTELLQEVLRRLDVRSLTMFKHVNKLATLLVDNLPEYKTILTFVPKVLECLLAIGTDQWIDCQTLYSKICTAACESCGDFGGYLYLITCKRVCYLCFTQDKLYLPLTTTFAGRMFGIPRRVAIDIPHMKVVSGKYSHRGKKVSSCTLVDYKSALDAGKKFHGSVSAMLQYVSYKSQEKVNNYLERVVAQVDSPNPYRPRQPPANRPADHQAGEPLRYVAIARVPAFDPKLQKLEWGFYCLGCSSSIERSSHCRQMFSEVTFADHIKQKGVVEGRRHIKG